MAGGSAVARWREELARAERVLDALGSGYVADSPRARAWRRRTAAAVRLLRARARSRAETARGGAPLPRRGGRGGGGV